MVRVYDRTCLYCYKTNESGSKRCIYCDNELPYREVSESEELKEKYGSTRESRTNKEIMMEGGGVELSKS